MLRCNKCQTMAILWCIDSHKEINLDLSIYELSFLKENGSVSFFVLKLNILTLNYSSKFPVIDL